MVLSRRRAILPASALTGQSGQPPQIADCSLRPDRLSPLLRTLLFYVYPVSTIGVPNYVLMPCRADALFLGVLSAYAVRQADILAALKNHQRLLHTTFALLLASVITVAFTYPERSGVIMNTVGYTLLRCSIRACC